MRDALGALGPVDGINPELSNLTISVTTLQKGDIVMVGTDGLTDNFDPNVCKFTVNTVETLKPKQQNAVKSPQKKVGNRQPLITENKLPVHKIDPQKPPIKPPRRSKNRELAGDGSFDRGSIKSSSVSEKSTSPSVENDRLNATPDCSGGPQGQQNSGESVETSPERSKDTAEFDNPLVVQFMRENSLDEAAKTSKGK